MFHQSQSVTTTCNDDRIKAGWPSLVSSVGTTIGSKQEIENPKKNAAQTAEVRLTWKKTPNYIADTLLRRIVTPTSKYDLRTLVWVQEGLAKEKKKEKMEHRRSIKQKMWATRTQELLTVMRSGLFGPSPIANVIKKEKPNTEKVFFLKSHKLRICDSEIRFHLRRRKN